MDKIELKSHKPDWEWLGAQSGCPRYSPCPLCGKCRSRAPHLSTACQSCPIPICTHKDKDIGRLIKRENFAIKQSQLGPDAAQGFRDLLKVALTEGWVLISETNLNIIDSATPVAFNMPSRAHSVMDMSEEELLKLATTRYGKTDVIMVDIDENSKDD